MSKPRFQLIIAATGSVAAMKVPDIIDGLKNSQDSKEYDFELHLVVTERAKHFINVSDIPKDVKIYDDALEWDSWQKRGDPVLHVELGKLADMMVIAPLDANTLGVIASGISNTLLSCTVRAWDMSKPLLFCPAMNVRMWTHPITAQQTETLKKWGYIEVPPITKKLMCGDVGLGAMAHIDDIIDAIKKKADDKFKKISKQMF